MPCSAYRQCPCGTKIPLSREVLRCPGCGRPVDPTWNIFYQQDNVDAMSESKKRTMVQPERRVQQETLLSRRTPVREQPAVEKSALERRESEARCPAAQPNAARTGWNIRMLDQSVLVPAQGEICLGRCGAGSRQLEGNILVSRRHVYLWINQEGRLLAEDRGSTNGTWYTRQGQKTKMKPYSVTVLENGDILWLYHFPVKVERCDEKTSVDRIPCSM